MPTTSPTTTSPAAISSPATTAATAPAAARPKAAVGETLFGFHTESAAATAAVVVVLVVLALVALVARPRWIFLGIVALAGVLALLDAREALHQHDEARAGLVVAAVALAVAHLLASGLAAFAFRHDE